MDIAPERATELFALGQKLQGFVGIALSGVGFLAGIHQLRAVRFFRNDFTFLRGRILCHPVFRGSESGHAANGYECSGNGYFAKHVHSSIQRTCPNISKFVNEFGANVAVRLQNRMELDR
ncbi:hypothetical protein ACWGS9_29485 [Bradyrhizobium sp. Arg314]